jgi:hypothetical protein
MKDYLGLWNKKLLEQCSFSVDRSVTVVGERDQHLGPRWEKAKVQVTVEPSMVFEVVNAVHDDKELQKFGYPDWVVFGLLDVLMVAFSAPVRNVRIILEKAEYDPVLSSAMAFRQAGRDAGRKIIQALNKS